MWFVEKLKLLFTWKTLSALLGLLLAIIGAWPVVFKDKPQITYEVTNETSILDIKQSVNNLSIMFQGEDIQKKSLDLKIITLRITNNGDIDIPQSFYDQTIPWGISISTGKIIEYRFSSTNDYITSRLLPKLVTPDFIEFNKIIFEKGKSFSLELLILYPKESPPTIEPKGKIMGINNFSIISNLLADDNLSVVSKVAQGSIWIHLLRVIVYVFIAALVLSSIMILLFLDIKYESYKRKKTILRQSDCLQSLNNPEIGELIVNFYSDFGYAELQKLNKAIQSKTILEKVISSPLFNNPSAWTSPVRLPLYMPDSRIGVSLNVFRTIELFFNKSVITKEENVYIVNKSLLDTLDQLLIKLNS